MYVVGEKEETVAGELLELNSSECEQGNQRALPSFRSLWSINISLQILFVYYALIVVGQMERHSFR